MNTLLPNSKIWVIILGTLSVNIILKLLYKICQDDGCSFEIETSGWLVVWPSSVGHTISAAEDEAPFSSTAKYMIYGNTHSIEAWVSCPL